MTVKQLQAGSDWGTLSATPVRQIAEGLLNRESTRTFLPKKAVAALKAILRT
jgi:hypothetical protein